MIGTLKGLWISAGLDGCHKAHYAQQYAQAVESSCQAGGNVLPYQDRDQSLQEKNKSFTKDLAANGGDILTLQRVLGHSSLVMTMRYAHFSPGHLAEVVKLNPLADSELGARE